MGEHANDSACLTWIQANKWDSNGDGTGNPQNGMFYYNTTSHEFMGYQNGSWGALGSGVSDHGALTGLGDDDHSQYHNDTRGDARYYQKTEFLQTSAGAGDAGKPIKLDADGNVDASMINDADIDHTNIGSIGTNSHADIDTHIADADKHREINDGATGTTDLWSANKINGELTAISSGYSRRKKCINIATSTSAPPTEVSGDRYILDFSGAPHADWDGASQGDIVEFNGTSWVATSPTEGWVAYLDAQNKDAIYVDDGSPAWEVRDVAVSDHGDLSGLGDDDHSQYHNDTRGDARYRTQTELSSTTPSSEGASLIGTDTKTKLNNATTVEDALTDLDGKDPPKRLSGAGNPNASGGTAGAVGDMYHDTTNDIPYVNLTGTNTGWMVV
jgi:hypothetical protein